jgi:hypothetical protein
MNTCVVHCEIDAKGGGSKEYSKYGGFEVLIVGDHISQQGLGFYTLNYLKIFQNDFYV